VSYPAGTLGFVVSYPIWSDPKVRHHVRLQWHLPDACSEGGISLSGQMLGIGEYEYAFLVNTSDVPLLWAAFGMRVHGDRQFLALEVSDRYEEMKDTGVGEWLTQHGVPFSIWSRVED
jgi:hypothetical protein